MTAHTQLDLLDKLQTHKTLWCPPGYSQLLIPVEVHDVRKVFNRIDVLISPYQGGSGQVWVSLETIHGVPFD